MAKPIGHLIAYEQGLLIKTAPSTRKVYKLSRYDRWSNLTRINGYTIKQLSCGKDNKEYYQAEDQEGSEGGVRTALAIDYKYLSDYHAEYEKENAFK